MIRKSSKNDLLLTRKKIRVVSKELNTAQIETKLDDFLHFISTSIEIIIYISLMKNHL